MYDYNKLRGRIKEKGYSQEKVANELNIDKSTLSLKLNNKALFSQDEINAIVKLLNISGENIKEYFFKEKV